MRIFPTYGEGENKNRLFPKIIKNYKTKLVKIDGFWHSIDNIKDIIVIDNKNKNKNNYKFDMLNRLKAFIQSKN
tara:strand:+ start:352 stop:573 length:222 start_codon:yes stop_codon:yes gene_type:complete